MDLTDEAKVKRILEDALGFPLGKAKLYPVQHVLLEAVAGNRRGATLHLKAHDYNVDDTAGVVYVATYAGGVYFKFPEPSEW